MVKFVVAGEPKGKGRPRFRSCGKFVQTYTDKDTVSYENLVRLSYRAQYSGMAFKEDDMIKCKIAAYYSIPKSVSKKKREQMLNGIIRPIKKPDLDNLQKSLFDGLNSVAFHDDAQIVSIVCDKFYGEEPRVEIELEKVGENA